MYKTEKGRKAETNYIIHNTEPRSQALPPEKSKEGGLLFVLQATKAEWRPGNKVLTHTIYYQDWELDQIQRRQSILRFKPIASTLLYKSALANSSF